MSVTTIKKIVKRVKYLCAGCTKPINPEYAVPTDQGLKHQSCFRNGL